MSFFNSARKPLKEDQFMSPDAARFYDAHARRFMGPVFRKLTARAASLEIPGNRILDIGTGTGLLATLLAREKPEWRITGIDIAEEMLAIARETAVRNGIAGQTEFLRASAEALPFLDNSYDLVVSNTSLHLWGEPLKVFSEIARVTAPGGYCLIWDNMRPAKLNPIPVIAGFLLRMNKNQRRLWMNAMQSAYTLNEARELLNKSPFKDARVVKYPGLMMFGIEWKKQEAPLSNTFPLIDK